MVSGYDKRYFRLAFGLTMGLAVVLVLQMTEVITSGPLVAALMGGLVAAAIVIAARAFLGDFNGLTVPRPHTPQHYLMLLSQSVQTAAIAFLLHGAFYALFWFVIPLFTSGDEPVFFLILLIVVPAGFIAGAVGRAWQWAVTQTVDEMQQQGITLPASGGYYAPVGAYIWLWQYGKGVSALTKNRITAAGTFAAVFFLGIIGFFIIRKALEYHRRRLANPS